MIQPLAQSYMASLAAHPIATKMATASALALGSDVAAQTIGGASPLTPSFEWRRAASLALFGCFYSGLAQHFIFGAYARRWPVLGVNPTAKLISVASTVFCHLCFTLPFLYFPALFLSTALVRGQGLGAGIQAYKQETPNRISGSAVCSGSNTLAIVSKVARN